MTNEDFPALHIASDAASGYSQRRYFCVLRVQLGSFVLVSALAMGAAIAPQYQKCLYIVAAGVLAIGLTITFIARERKYDRTWFDCRAIAESVKTATWRYMMRIPPFDTNDIPEAHVKFVEELNEIRRTRSHVATALAGKTSSTLNVTEYMDRVRKMSLAERRECYIAERLNDQQCWYTTKVVANQQTGGIWYWTMIAFQVGALIVAIVIAALGAMPFAPVSLLMTLAASATAWSQAKRHDELTNSYALAADELTRLQGLAENITTELEFHKLVEDVEEAVSREHTMWCARRSLTPWNARNN